MWERLDAEANSSKDKVQFQSNHIFAAILTMQIGGSGSLPRAFRIMDKLKPNF
jgi:hypothetical protein